MDDYQEWVTDIKEAFNLRLERSKEDKKLLKESVSDETYKRLTNVFHPPLLYFIFGDAEVVYGYKGLKVDLFYTSGSLRIYLNIKYDEKLSSEEDVGPLKKRQRVVESFEPTDDQEQDASDAESEQEQDEESIPDIKKKLMDYLPDDYTESLEEFHSWVEQDALSFTPVGTAIARYILTSKRTPETKKSSDPWRSFYKNPEHYLSNLKTSYTFIDINTEPGKTENIDPDVVYELFHTTWDTPGYKEFHSRMEFFTPMSIECATYLDTKDHKWEFINLFERRRRPDGSLAYHWIGFVSLYGFLYYPDKTRMRVAQFLIAPPFTGNHHGLALYDAIYQYLKDRRPDVKEIVFEEPSEIMDDIRDRVEFTHLLKSNEFRDAVKLPEPDSESLKQVKNSYKIASRQFDRLIDMGILALNDVSDPEKEKLFRLWTKARLYRVNHEVLVQMEADEIKEKLHETFETNYDYYKRALDLILK